jgi:hypothetical protein
MAAYLPTDSDDANRAQLVSNLWWTVGDLLMGTDVSRRVDPANLRADGLIGPAGSAVSYGVAADGTLYIRGTAARGTAAAASVGGFAIMPGLLIMAVLAFFALRK